MRLGTMNLPAEQLLFAVWQVSATTALVILPLLAFRRLLRRRYPARALCAVWTVLLVRLLVPVQLSLPEPPVQVAPRLTRMRYVQEFTPVGQPPAGTAQKPEDAGFTYGNYWVETAEVPEIEGASGATYIGALLFLGWALTALLLLWVQLTGYRAYSRQLKRTAQPPAEEGLCAAYRDECARLGLKRPPALRSSPAADGPMLVGLLRPVLYLPAQGLQADAAPMVFRHELAHYQRRDLWRKLAAAVVRCAHWFNPAAYLLTRALYEDIELACDSRAVEGMDDEARRRYGKAILDCAASQCAVRQPLTTCFTSDKEKLKTRLGELFATGTKKRGIALLVVCAFTVGIVGGAVYIGSSTRAAAPATEEEVLAAETLTTEAVDILSNAWSDSMLRGAPEKAMPYLTRRLQQTVFYSMDTPVAEDGTRFDFDPDDPYYGVPEDCREWFWNNGWPDIGVQPRTVIPELENSAAYVVHRDANGITLADHIFMYIHFEKEDGAWRISRVDSNAPENPFGSSLSYRVDSARRFQLEFGYDLGLLDFYPLWDLYSNHPEVNYGGLRIGDPVTAAMDLLGLEGEGEITGDIFVENPDGSPANWLGKSVHWTFPDGSSIDIVMAEMYGEGYIPVDWSIGGMSQRTALDLANQWARGTVNKDTHQMFPLLTENATAELIEVQRNYSGEEDGTWHWKHGKYGSSPTAEEYGIYLEDGGTALIVYAVGDSGGEYYRVCERLRFRETLSGLKIDSVRELTNRENEQGGNCVYEYVPYSEKEWFALRFMQDFDTDNFPLTLGRLFYTNFPDDGDERRKYLHDPVETAREVLHIVPDGKPYLISGETQGDVVLVSQDANTATVRIDFADGGNVFAGLDRSEESGRWGITALRDAEDRAAIDTADAFAAAYGVQGGSEYLWTDAYRQAREGTDAPPLQELFHLTEDTSLGMSSNETDLFGQPYGYDVTVTFPDQSQVLVKYVRDTDTGKKYPVDWEIVGQHHSRNTRGMRDLASQWAAAWQARDTKPLYAILSDEGKEQLYDQQSEGSDGYFIDRNNWKWKLNEYNADGHGYMLREIDEDTMEIVYTENMHGCENFQAVQRVHFVTEGQKLRIDSWEDVDVSGMNDYEHYETYCLPSYPNFQKELEIDVLGTPEGMSEPEYAAYELAGCDPHQFAGVTVQGVSEIRILGEDGWVPAYEVALQFGDGSGNLLARVSPDGDGAGRWRLEGIQLS